MSAPRLGAAPERKYAAALASVDADGRFCGYASLFGRMDLGGDVVMPGAFARTLRLRGAGGVRMLLEHDPGAPIGVWLTLEEDRRGLWVEGRIVGTPGAARAGARMAAGELDGLSIGFRTVRSRPRPGGGRVLTELDLWEVSIVTFPMLGTARLTVHAPARQPGPQAAHAA